jgi:hypothetical protein
LEVERGSGFNTRILAARDRFKFVNPIMACHALINVAEATGRAEDLRAARWASDDLAKHGLLAAKAITRLRIYELTKDEHADLDHVLGIADVIDDPKIRGIVYARIGEATDQVKYFLAALTAAEAIASEDERRGEIDTLLSCFRDALATKGKPTISRDTVRAFVTNAALDKYPKWKQPTLAQLDAPQK